MRYVKSLTLLLLSCTFLLTSCSVNNTVSESSSHVSFNNSLSTSSQANNENPSADIYIPNPKTASDFTTITMRDPKIDDILMTDLSFAGFDKKVQITSFATGCITTSNDLKQNQRAYVTYNYPVDYKTANDTNSIKPGTSFVLCVSTGEDLINPEYYIVVLDYTNKKVYKIKSVLQYHQPILTVRDLTGDGMDDIIVSNVNNGYRSGTTFEVFRFDGNGLKRIYQNVIDNNINSPYFSFSAHLANDYKAIIECKKIGFKKTVSLLDAGFTQEDLEIDDTLTPENKADDYYKTQFFRCYKNGRIIKDRLEIDAHAGALDDEQGLQFENIDSYYQLKLMYVIYIGKWNEICKTFAYMKYNPQKDILEIEKASLLIDYGEQNES